MSQSSLQFTLNNLKTVYLNVQSIDDESLVTINEKNIIPDPSDFYYSVYNGTNPNNNRVLIHGGYAGRKINISGFLTSETNHKNVKSAFIYGVKIYPTLYPPLNGNTAIDDADGSVAYYITKYSTSRSSNSSMITFDLELTSHVK